MAQKDYYEVLGVSKDADKKQIKKAFRSLAKEKHPDRNKSANAEEEFREIQEAYEVLSDDQKRKAYDQYGHAGAQGFGGGSPFGQAGGGFGGATQEDLNDILNSFFGGQGFGGFGFGSAGGGQNSRGTRGADIEATLKVDFSEAVFGKYKTINYRRKVECDRCDGKGAESAKDIEKCDVCGGSGRVQQVQNTFLGTIQTTTNCSNCQGSGEVIKNNCSKCSGQGRVEIDDNFKIKIPPGIPDGVTLRFRERGNAGLKGGSAGDLFITIDVADHAELERRGDDIYTEIQIHVTTAVLGGEVEVPSVRDDITLKIPPGTESGKIFRLSGKGGPKFKGNGNGDQYIKVIVEIPKKLTRRQAQLWSELEEIKDKKPGLFGK